MEESGKVLHIGYSDDYVANRVKRLANEIAEHPYDWIGEILPALILHLETTAEIEDSLELFECYRAMNLALMYYQSWQDGIE